VKWMWASYSLVHIHFTNLPKSTLLTLPILNSTMENCLLDKFGKWTLHVHHVHLAKWPSPNPHHQLAKSQSPHCQVTKPTLPSHWEQFESLNHEFYFFFVSNLSEWRGEIESPSTFYFLKINFLTMSDLCSWMKLILMDEFNPIDWMNFICESC
jgi:hypothetical protein